jgi:ethanolamine phosphate phosphodiesterase
MRSIQWKLPSPRRLLTSLNLLRLTWILLFFYTEQHVYKRAIETCSWPFETSRECRIAVIADPQIIDENTYPRRGLSMWLTKIFTDRYMRRNYKLLMAQDPGTAMFLGDLMDGGREWEDEKYFLQVLC